MAGLNVFFIKQLYDRINTSASTDQIAQVVIKIDDMSVRLARVETRVRDLKDFIENERASLDAIPNIIEASNEPKNRRASVLHDLWSLQKDR